MRYLTLRERDVVRVGHGHELSEREADGIAKLAEILPRGSVGWEHRALRFGPFCGVLRTPELTIELLPKTDRGSAPVAEPRGLLVAMLAATGRVRFPGVGDAGLGHQAIHLLDVFIHDFCDRVKIALRGGAIAAYIERNENLRELRGRLRLTEHLLQNAFNQSRVLCRFDERTIDNPFNRALKHVLRVLLSHAVDPQTRASVTSLLHRLDEVADRRVRVADLDVLRFDRTNERWRDVFDQAKGLLAGLFPDVRAGNTEGSALLFNMERLFEDVLGWRIARMCRTLVGAGSRVEFQRPQRTLASSDFLLRPDVTVFVHDRLVVILDAKWKELKPDEPHADVSSADAYQMNAYAGRYRCNRLVLVYPSSSRCAPGHVREFYLQTPGQPVVEVVAVDLYDLALGSGPLAGLEGMLARLRGARSGAEHAKG